MEMDIKKLVGELTLEEKAGLCSGLDFWHTKPVERLGIPSLMVTDGPHGLRKQELGADHLGLYDSVPATCFPSAAGLASSWNKQLVRKVGEALGTECQALDVAVLLGPGANIKRSPLCGRNFEYFSEDPYLSSEMAAAHIQGVQSQGVGTSLKHFAVNNQEYRRMSTSANVDERTLREIYLASFEGAVKQAQPWTVMCSYNKVNQVYASENESLLTDILRDEWDFSGFVVSDWGAVDDRVNSLKAGLELEMPAVNGMTDKKIIEAVKAGSLPIEVLDQAVERFLGIVAKAVANNKEHVVFDAAAHHQIAREAARESMVLLKNEDHMLPLKKQGTVAVIGEFGVKPRFQGGGSSHVNPTRLDNIVDEIRAAAGPDTVVSYAQGYDILSDDVNVELVKEAAAIAGQSDAAVLFVGLPDRYESEGYDRVHLSLPQNHIHLIEEIARVQPNIVIVLSNGSPVEMPWIVHAKAVLEGYLGGQALGGAIADLLFGDANPSGRLAETFPNRLSDTPAFLNFPGEGDNVNYQEGIFVGYRYYDKKSIEPLFPFGHGLSYTSFEYSNFVISDAVIKDTDTVTIAVDIMNTGDRAGKEVVQLYVSDCESTVNRPDKELKGFEKIELNPGERTTVAFTLDKRAFAYYNVELGDWHVESGEFVIMIGQSSRNIKLQGSVEVQSTVKLPKTIHRNSLLGDLLNDPELAPAVQAFMSQAQQSGALGGMDDSENEAADMLEAIMKFIPLRALLMFGQGKVTEDMINELIKDLNQQLTDNK